MFDVESSASLHVLVLCFVFVNASTVLLVFAQAHDIPVEIEAASSPNSTKERTPLVARAPKPSVDISPLLHSTEATDVFVSSVRSPAQLRSPHYRGAGTPASGTAVTALQA